MVHEIKPDPTCSIDEPPAPSIWPYLTLLLFACGVLILCLVMAPLNANGIRDIFLLGDGRSQSRVFEPGKTIRALYSTRSKRLSHVQVQWSISLDNGATWVDLNDTGVSKGAPVARVVDVSPTTNGIEFQVNSWSPQCVIRAWDSIRFTSEAFTVEPKLRLLTGPGSTSTNSIVYTNQTSTIQMSWDKDYITPDVTWSLALSETDVNSEWITASSATYQINYATQRLTWTPGAAFTSHHLRYRVQATVGSKTVSVTSYELFDKATPPSPIKRFTITALTFVATGSVKPDDVVTIRATYANAAWPPLNTMEFFYKTATSALVAIHNISPVSDSQGVRTFSWKAPSVSSPVSLVIRYNSDQDEITSTNVLVVGPAFAFTSLQIQGNPDEVVHGATITLLLSWTNGPFVAPTQWLQSFDGGLTTSAITPTLVGTTTTSPVTYTFVTPNQNSGAYLIKAVRDQNQVQLPKTIRLKDPQVAFAVTQLKYVSTVPSVVSPAAVLDLQVVYVGDWASASLNFVYSLDGGGDVSISHTVTGVGTVRITAPNTAALVFQLKGNGILAPPLRLRSGFILYAIRPVSGSIVSGKIVLDFVLDFTGVPTLPSGTWEYQTNLDVAELWRPVESMVSLFGPIFQWTQTVSSQVTNYNLRFTSGDQSTTLNRINLPVGVHWDYPQKSSDTVHIISENLRPLLKPAFRIRTQLSLTFRDTDYQVVPFLVGQDGNVFSIPSNQIQWDSSSLTLYWWITDASISSGNYWFEIRIAKGTTWSIVARSAELISFVTEPNPPLLYSRLVYDSIRGPFLTLDVFGCVVAYSSTQPPPEGQYFWFSPLTATTGYIMVGSTVDSNPNFPLQALSWSPDPFEPFKGFSLQSEVGSAPDFLQMVQLNPGGTISFVGSTTWKVLGRYDIPQYESQFRSDCNFQFSLGQGTEAKWNYTFE